MSDNPSEVLLLITGDLLFPSPLLRIEKMLPGLRLPNSLNPFLLFPLDWDSEGGGSVFSVCTSIFSLFPPFSVSSRHSLQLLFPSQWSEHLYPDLLSSSVCFTSVALGAFLYRLSVSLPLSVSPIQPFLLYFSLESPSPLPRFCLAALPGCHSN